MAEHESAERPQTPSGTRPRGHGARSEAVRERAIVSLLTEKTIGAAAKRCGVNERTLRRWMTADDAFRRELAEARTAIYQAGMARVQALTSKAVETLEVLMGATRHPSVRLGAARTVAELAMHQHDAEEIMRKLDDIEALQRRNEGRR
jgi:hypothetical protein